MPAWSACREGRFTRNDQSTRAHPLTRMSPINRTKLSSAMVVNAIATSLNSLSFILAEERFLLIALLVFFADPETQVIQQEREREQRNPGGEDAAVFNGVLRHVAHAHLYNIGGNGLYRMQRVEGELWLLTGGYGHDHRFAQGPGNGQNHRYHDSGACSGYQHVESGLEAVRAEPV